VTGIYIGLIKDRIYDLQLGDEEIAAVIRPGDMLDTDRLDPEHVTVAQLGRLAELLGLRPAELLSDAPTDYEEAFADGMLAEFALAGAGGEEGGWAQLPDWSAARLEQASSTLNPTAMGVADALYAEATGGRSPGTYDAPRYRAYFAARTAPDPFDAAGLARLLGAAGPGAGATGYTCDAQARRLAAHALVVIDGAAGAGPAPFAEVGFDTPVTVHPDLLYALDLAPAPPTPSTAQAAANLREEA
jgi:hypothetical protein